MNFDNGRKKKNSLLFFTNDYQKNLFNTVNEKENIYLRENNLDNRASLYQEGIEMKGINNELIKEDFHLKNLLVKYLETMNKESSVNIIGMKNKLKFFKKQAKPRKNSSQKKSNLKKNSINLKRRKSSSFIKNQKKLNLIKDDEFVFPKKRYTEGSDPFSKNKKDNHRHTKFINFESRNISLKKEDKKDIDKFSIFEQNNTKRSKLIKENSKNKDKNSLRKDSSNLLTLGKNFENDKKINNSNTDNKNKCEMEDEININSNNRLYNIGSSIKCRKNLLLITKNNVFSNSNISSPNPNLGKKKKFLQSFINVFNKKDTSIISQEKNKNKTSNTAIANKSKIKNITSSVISVYKETNKKKNLFSFLQEPELFVDQAPSNYNKINNEDIWGGYSSISDLSKRNKFKNKDNYLKKIIERHSLKSIKKQNSKNTDLNNLDNKEKSNIDIKNKSKSSQNLCNMDKVVLYINNNKLKQTECTEYNKKCELPSPKIMGNENYQNDNDLNINKKKLILEYTKTKSKNDSINKSLTPTKELYEQRNRLLSRKGNVYDSFDDDIDYDPEIIGEFYIHPGSTFNKIYQFIILISSLYSTIFTPIFLAKNLDLDYKLTKFNLFNLIEDFIDILFIADLIINFFLAYYNIDENLITNCSSIATNYLFSWFKFDLVMAIPFNFILLNFSSKINGKSPKYYNMGNKNIIHVLQFIRSLKIIKVFLTNRMVTNILNKIMEIQHFSRHWNVYQCLGIMVFSMHILSCLYILIGQITYPSWITISNMENSNFGTLYLTGIYYLITTLTTVGYGDITPKNVKERVFSLILLLLGTLGYSYLVSSLSSIVNLNDQKQLKYSKKCEILNEIRITNNQMSLDLFKRISKYIKYTLDHEDIDKNMFINELPYGLRNTLMYEIYKPILDNFIFFKNNKNNIDFVTKVLMAFKPILASKGDILVKEGDFIEEIIFVKNGSLNIEIPLPFSIVNPNKNHNKDFFKDLLESASLENDSKNKRLSKLITGNINKELGNISNKRSIKISNKKSGGKNKNKENNQIEYMKILEIRKNEYFGDVIMFLNKRSPLCIRVKTRIAELFFLKKTDSIEISMNYPQIWRKINKKSLFNMEQIEKLRNKAIKMCMDLNGYKKDNFKDSKLYNKAFNKCRNFTFGTTSVDNNLFSGSVELTSSFNNDSQSYSSEDESKTKIKDNNLVTKMSPDKNKVVKGFGMKNMDLVNICHKKNRQNNFIRPNFVDEELEKFSSAQKLNNLNKNLFENIGLYDDLKIDKGGLKKGINQIINSDYESRKNIQANRSKTIINRPNSISTKKNYTKIKESRKKFMKFNTGEYINNNIKLVNSKDYFEDDENETSNKNSKFYKCSGKITKEKINEKRENNSSYIEKKNDKITKLDIHESRNSSKDSTTDYSICSSQIQFTIEKEYNNLNEISNFKYAKDKLFRKDVETYIEKKLKNSLNSLNFNSTTLKSSKFLGTNFNPYNRNRVRKSTTPINNSFRKLTIINCNCNFETVLSLSSSSSEKNNSIKNQPKIEKKLTSTKLSSSSANKNLRQLLNENINRSSTRIVPIINNHENLNNCRSFRKGENTNKPQFKKSKQNMLKLITQNIASDSLNLNNPKLFYSEYFQKMLDEDEFKRKENDPESYKDVDDNVIHSFNIINKNSKDILKGSNNINT